MGEIIVRKVRGMNWKAKLSLVLIFTMIFSGFMYQGGYSPRIEKAEAASGDVYLLWDGASGSPPSGWTYVSTWNNSFIRGAATAGGTGGTSTHSHTAGAVTHDDASTSSGGNAGSGNPDITHTHNVATSSIATGSNEPSYRTLVLIKSNAPATIPAGAIALFDATPPAGWTQYAAENGYYVKLSATATSTGGNAGNQHSHSVTFTTPIGNTINSTRATSNKNTTATSTHNHTLAATPSVSATYEPSYREAILAKADANIALTSCNGMIALFDAAPPANWASISGTGSAFENMFIKAAAAYGGTGGGGTHTHSVSATTGTASATQNSGANGANGSALGTHTHTVSTTLQATTETAYMPPYINFIIAKYTYIPSGNLAVADGSSLGAADAPRSSINNVLDSFTLGMSAGSGTVSSLTITGSTNFNSTNIPTNGVKIYRDAGTPGVYDSGVDTLISSSSTAISGGVTTVTLASAETVTSTASYLVAVDINSGATLTNTITGYVTAASGTGLGTPTYNDSGSATLTVTAAATLTIDDGTTLGTANAPQGSTNRVLDSFTMAMSAGSGSVSTLTVTGSANFNSTNIPTNGVKIYRDAGTPGAYDSGIDTLLSSGSTAISGSATTVTLTSPETVTATASYLVTVDVNVGATLTNSFTGTISAATGSGIGTPVDNDSSSATLTVTPPALSSTIDSCAGCHQYSPTFSDGTARNTPAGQFPGSHNKHVQGQGHLCSVCHAVPADETADSFKHRNGTIEMANPINANTGAAYTKGTSWAQTNSPSAFTACTNTYCHGGTSQAWGTVNSDDVCVKCHGVAGTSQAAPGYNATGKDTDGDNAASDTSVGAHDTHLRALSGYSDPIACTECHTVPTAVGDSGHNDSARPAELTWGTLATKNGATPDTYSRPNCTNTYCHFGNSIGGYSPATANASVSWTNTSYLNGTLSLTGDCGKCHLSPPSTTGNHSGVSTIDRCNDCHSHVNTDGTFTAGANRSKHINGLVDSSGGDCTSATCHGNAVNTSSATRALDPTVTQRRAITPEFGANWSHRRTGGPVSKYDCGVCHLEGDPIGGGTVSPYHMDGYIDLRDPDVNTANTMIKDFNNADYHFVRFSISFSSKATSASTNTTEYIVAQRFCLKCHDSGGAASTYARRTDVGGSATQPFGSSGGTRRDVDAHFATTNSSAHPVKGPRQNSYANTNTMDAPYAVSKTPGTPSNGVVMTCWDCHNVPGASPWTTQTIDSHGSGANASILRGTIWVASPTLCSTCHKSAIYESTAQVHASGSAFVTPSISNMGPGTDMLTCNNCHFSAITKPARPRPAEDIHGFNSLVSGGNWPNYGNRPYAFIRNTEQFKNHRPFRSPENTTGNAGCNLGGTSPTCSHRNMPTTAGDTSATYTPGGTY